MNEVAKHTRLARRGSRYYIRAKVPVDVQALYAPKREITYSLKTSDLKTALERVKVESLKVDQEFAEARRRQSALGPAEQEFTKEEAQRLAQLWLSRVLEEDEDTRREGLTPREYQKDAVALSLIEPGSAEALAMGDAHLVDDDAEDLIEEHRLQITKGSPDYKLLAYELLKANVRYAEAFRGRHEGKLIETPPAPPSATPKASPQFTQNGPMLSEVFAKWLQERQPPAKTERDWKTYLRRFEELHGDLPVSAITKAHVRKYKEALQKLPRVQGKTYHGLKIQQAIKKAGEDPSVERLSIPSVNKGITAVASVLEWAARNGFCNSNPAQKMRIPDHRRNKDKRLPYSPDDLRAIFVDSPVYREGHRPMAGAGEAAHWLPLLGLYTGARLEELGQLLVSDVRQGGEGGIWYLDINEVEESKRLKTRGSRRVVPLHPKLIERGFLGYVEEVKGQGHERLFPDLKVDLNKTITGNFSKWYGRFARDRLGITDRRKVFHSLRHNFKDACRAAGVEEAVADALQGHTGNTVSRAYGSGYPLERLAEEIAKVDYEGI